MSASEGLSTNEIDWGACVEIPGKVARKALSRVRKEWFPAGGV